MSLGATIRAWRDRLSPADAGLPAGRARRAAGLRREELAELAGLSMDYVVRLEQGRATRPSAQVTGALARALQLTVQERDHLYRLAGLRPPADGMLSEHIPPGMRRILNRLGETPVAVFAADWRLVWWNRGWAAVLGDPSAVAPDDRSLVKSRFPVPGDTSRTSDWPVVVDNQETSDRAIVADLRRASGRYPADRRLDTLIRSRLEGNTRFAELWREAAVGGHAEDHKTVRHPSVGDIHVDCDVLTDSDTDLKIVVFTVAPGSENESKMDLARVMGAARVLPKIPLGRSCGRQRDPGRAEEGEVPRRRG